MNIGRFKQGMDPDKTAFADIEVPILNLLVNDIIYSFIDWPGEKFIDGSVIHNDDFMYDTRRVIRKARHFFCFLEPSQIDMNRKQSEERVRFSASELAERFEEHMMLTLPEEKAFNKLRSITYILNKIDLFMGDENNQPNPNANVILEIYHNKSELSAYSEGKWNKAEFNSIDQTTRQFLQIENPTLYNDLSDMGRFKGIPTAFVPVAPYGEKKDPTAGQIVHNTRLAGIPLLRIIELDKPLTAKRS